MFAFPQYKPQRFLLTKATENVFPFYLREYLKRLKVVFALLRTGDVTVCQTRVSERGEIPVCPL